MKASKLMKLLPPRNILLKRYYGFEGEIASQLLLFCRCINELYGMKMHNNISRTDVTSTSSEMKEVEVLVRTLLETALLMDCWLFSAWSLMTAKTVEEA